MRLSPLAALRRDREHLIQPNPLLPITPCLLTWRTNFFARGGEYPSTLVSGLQATAPTFASPPTLSHPTVPHSSGYIIYTDNISSSSRPCLEQDIHVLYITSCNQGYKNYTAMACWILVT
jgi:hypothetical protein